MRAVARRESALVAVIAGLCAVLAFLVPSYFSLSNLTDIFLANLPTLIIALGMTLVILTGQIDISVGSTFAIAGIAVGVFAKSGMPLGIAVLLACLVGAIVGAINGALVAFVHVPSIVVTLATMVSLRDALRWATQGAWVKDLPPSFQWLGLSQTSYPSVMLLLATVLTISVAWGLRNLQGGRAVYATGSNEEAARLSGIPTSIISFSVFALLGFLTGLAAVLNAVRFNQIPSNAGLGLEMKVIAAVVVGGAAITGGAGTIVGTVLGVVLLSAMGPALTFLGVDAAWEKAIQGAIILASLAMEVAGQRRSRVVLKINGSSIAAERA